MYKVLLVAIVTASLFVGRWTLGGGLLFAAFEILFYILFIVSNYKSLGHVTKLILKKNNLILGLLFIFTLNTQISIINGILGNTDYWIQVLSLNIRNFLLIFVGGTLFVDLSKGNESLIVKSFWIFTFFGFLQNALSITITHGLAGLLLNGVGVSAIALFAIYLFLSHQNILIKLVALVIVIASNSISAIAAYLVSVTIFRLRKVTLFWAIAVVLMYTFLTGRWGAQKFFRKDPEMMLSGTGRFDMYADCLTNISNNISAGKSCHSSYLTLISQYGIFGIFEVVLFIYLSFLFFIKSYPFRKDKDLWFIFSIIVFIAVNDFLLVTPSTLTISFCIIILQLNKRHNI